MVTVNDIIHVWVLPEWVCKDFFFELVQVIHLRRFFTLVLNQSRRTRFGIHIFGREN